MNLRRSYITLTAWYVLIVMVISLFFSITLYYAVAREYDRGPVFHPLSDDSTTIFQQQRLQDGSIAIRISAPDVAEEGKTRVRYLLLYCNIAILGASTFVSYFLAKRTLYPIEEMLDVQSRFTADAAHELRTPLTAMKTEIEVALRGGEIKPAEAKEIIQSNLEEIHKLEQLSNGLLHLSRYEHDSNHLGVELVAINECVETATKKLKPTAEKKGVELDVSIPPTFVSGNRHSLNELFTILIDNAVKYSNPDSKVTVRGITSRHSISISVADEGIGIRASDLPHIFDRFYRADHSRNKTHVDGYGLGLSIAKQVVTNHKGTISVESVINKGTTFSVVLPLVHSASSQK